MEKQELETLKKMLLTANRRGSTDYKVAIEICKTLDKKDLEILSYWYWHIPNVIIELHYLFNKNNIYNR